MSRPDYPRPSAANPAQDSGFWRRLTAGDHGLGKTFWLAWFLPVWFGGALLDGALEFVAGTGALVLGRGGAVLYLVYFGLATVWTWRAANKNPGGWAIAAKVWLGLNVAVAVLGALFVVFVLPLVPEA